MRRTVAPQVGLHRASPRSTLPLLHPSPRPLPRLNPSTTQLQPQPLQSHLHTACNVTHPHATSTPVQPRSPLARATPLPRTVAPPRPPVAVPRLNPSATQPQPQPPQLH